MISRAESSSRGDDQRLTGASSWNAARFSRRNRDIQYNKPFSDAQRLSLLRFGKAPQPIVGQFLDNSTRTTLQTLRIDARDAGNFDRYSFPRRPLDQRNVTWWKFPKDILMRFDPFRSDRLSPQVH